MFTIITLNNKKGVSSIELFEKLEMKQRYSDWLKDNLFSKMACYKEGEDFVGLERQSSGGRPRQNYWLSSDTAQELVMSSRCQKAREIKKVIIKLLNEHADGKWISVAQGKIIYEFLNEFKFIENQKKAEKIAIEHLSKHFVNNGFNYAMANKHRNEQLSYTTEQVRTEYEDFCKKNNMQIYKSLTKTQMTYYFNKYLLIRNAVWDFLIVKEYSNNPIEISEFVCRIAEEWGVEIYPKNEDNLFQSQESNKDLEYSELEVQKLELPT